MLHDTAWLDGPRRFPGELRLPGLACLVRTEATVEARGTIRKETRSFASSRPLSSEAAAEAIREHWAIENRLHWVLDVTFADDLVRAANDKRSIKSRRKRAGWDTTCLAAILASSPA